MVNVRPRTTGIPIVAKKVDVAGRIVAPGFIDTEMGRILDSLGKEGIAGDTIVLNFANEQSVVQTRFATGTHELYQLPLSLIRTVRGTGYALDVDRDAP